MSRFWGCLLASAALSSSVFCQQNPIPAGQPFADEINAFLRSDEKEMPATGGVLFVGSSTIRLWTSLAKDFPLLPVINRGFGGSIIAQSTQYADRIVIPYRPKIVVMFAGTNDLGSKSPAEVLKDYQEFVAKVHTALPDTRIVYLSINPTVARWKQEAAVLEANFLIERYTLLSNSKELKLSFIETHDPLLSADGQPQPSIERADGLHLNAKGYELFSSVIRARLYELAKIEGVIGPR